MTQREFTARLERMGLPPSFIRTLAQGRRGVEELLDQMQRVGPVTERDARAAIEFERTRGKVVVAPSRQVRLGEQGALTRRR